MDVLETLARELVLDHLFRAVPAYCDDFDVVAHWQQGEFHNDFVLSLRQPVGLPGGVLVVSTNCNAGVKEVLCLGDVPDRYALWKSRCPDNPEFEGTMPPVLGRARTMHWFDPCALLADDARSELKPAFRRRQRGGGWRQIGKGEE